jgi:outer membrane biosynthesis protein TonB
MKFTFLILTILLFVFSAFGQNERDKGIELYLQGDYNSSIVILQQAVQADKKDRDAWLFLGMSLARTRKNNEAIKALREGDSISSKDSSVYDKELKIISKPRPRYTESAKENLTSGIVKLAIEFGADGNIKSIIPIQSLPDGLTQNCIAAARNIEFEPAYKNGKPVSSIKIIEYTFEIR